MRWLQILLGCANCLYGIALVGRYGHEWPSFQGWPLSVQQQVLLLVVFAVLPLGVAALRFPAIAGTAEFACAFFGRQLVHDVGRPDLRQISGYTMALTLAVIAVAVVASIMDVTKEAFEEPERPSKKPRAA